jgi:hypothetical protein
LKTPLPFKPFCLLLASLIFVFSCGEQKQNTLFAPNAQNDIKSPHNTFSDGYSYEFSNIQCTTGQHARPSNREFCKTLQDEELNNHCESNSRLKLFREHCGYKKWKPFHLCNLKAEWLEENSQATYKTDLFSWCSDLRRPPHSIKINENFLIQSQNYILEADFFRIELNRSHADNILTPYSTQLNLQIIRENERQSTHIGIGTRHLKFQNPEVVFIGYCHPIDKCPVK